MHLFSKPSGRSFSLLTPRNQAGTAFSYHSNASTYQPSLERNGFGAAGGRTHIPVLSRSTSGKSMARNPAIPDHFQGLVLKQFGELGQNTFSQSKDFFGLT